MLARVVCNICKKDLKIKYIKTEEIGIVVIVESCQSLECAPATAEEHQEYDKHISDLFITDTLSDYFIGGEI